VSPLVHLLVRVAVALTPADRRARRQEQWLADVRDAPELGLAPFTLAVGALTTALFHRRGTRQTSWRAAMSATTVRRAPHTVRTVPVLVLGAFLVFLASVPPFMLLGRYSGTAAVWWLAQAIVIGVAVVPGAMIVAAVLLTDGPSRRRRVLSAVAVAALVTLWLGTMTGWIAVTGWYGIVNSLIAVGVAAVWFVLRGHTGGVWLLLVLPIVVGAVLDPVQAAAATHLPVAVAGAVGWLVQLAPFAADAGCVAAARLSTHVAPTVVSTPDTLVDKSV
jgi:hypothetical protein